MMETKNKPKVICVGKTTWSDELVDGWPVYFSEEAVRNLLRNEYKQCNRAVYIATRRKCDELIKVDESIEDAIKQLKGGNK